MGYKLRTALPDSQTLAQENALELYLKKYHKMTDRPNSTPQPDAAPKPQPVVVNYIFFVIFLTALSAFGSFVNDMYLPSLPSMRSFFGCSVSTVQLGLTFGMAGLAIGELLLGPISDRRGRKPVLYVSLALFCVAGILSVFSPTIHFFLGCRLVQGMGASGAYFLARSMPADVYGGRALAKVMATMGAVNGIAPAVAPALGGYISDHWTWKAVFITLTAFAVILIALTPRFKETLPKERRSTDSLLRTFAHYKSLLGNYRFMIHVLLKATTLGLFFGCLSSAPFIMQVHFGYTQTQFGLIMGGNALMIALGAMLSLRFRLLKQSAFVGATGLLIAVVAEAYVLLCCDSFWAYELLLLPIMLFMGMIFTAANTLAMNEGRNDAGGASALLGALGYVFGSVTSPLVGKGDIMHSTAWVFVVMAVLVMVCALLSRRIPADLGQ